MQKNNSPFRERIISKMRQEFKDDCFVEQRSQQMAEQAVYVVKEGPYLDMQGVRQLAESGRNLSNQQIRATVQALYNYMAHLLTVLENNQRCRLNWEGGILRGRVQRQNKIDLQHIQSQKVMLVRLIEQCKHCISSKSQFLNFIATQKKEIFNKVKTQGLIKNIRLVYLLEEYERYPLVEDISESRYLQLYDWTIQKLLSYYNFFKACLENKVSFNELQQKCFSLLQQDMVLIRGTTITQLIKFTLTLSLNQVKQIKKLSNSVLILKRKLVEEVIQAYYLGFLMNNDIKSMDDTLTNVQQTLTKHIKSLKINVHKQKEGHQKNSFLGNIDQILINQLSNKMDQVQSQFNKIYNFVANQKDCIFLRFYNRKFNKRMISLTKIQDKLTHLYKLLNNSDYAQCMWLAEQQKGRFQKRDAAIQQKMKQLVSLKKEIKVLNQIHFRLIFEEIQRTSLFVHEQEGYSHWNHSLLDFQTNLINQCLFDSSGKRIKKQKSVSPNLSTSIITYNVSKQDVFGQTILEIINKSQSLHASRVYNQEQFDKYAVVREAKDYFGELRAEFGLCLLDQHNFTAHSLPKLIRKLQKAFELTPYSEQPLNLQISQMLQSLKLLPYIIVTQVNEKKLNLMVYPKPNHSILSELKGILLSHQQTLLKVCSQINNNPIRRKAIHQKILSFIESRIKFLYGFVEQLQKLVAIIKVMQQSTIVKDSYDISQESTYNFILKLLLIQKQLKANCSNPSGFATLRRGFINQYCRFYLSSSECHGYLGLFDTIETR